MNLMTIMYIVMQEALQDPEDMASCYEKLRTYLHSLRDVALTLISGIEPVPGGLYDDSHGKAALGRAGLHASHSGRICD